MIRRRIRWNVWLGSDWGKIRVLIDEVFGILGCGLFMVLLGELFGMLDLWTV